MSSNAGRPIMNQKADPVLTLNRTLLEAPVTVHISEHSWKVISYSITLESHYCPLGIPPYTRPHPVNSLLRLTPIILRFNSSPSFVRIENWSQETDWSKVVYLLSALQDELLAKYRHIETPNTTHMIHCMLICHVFSLKCSSLFLITAIF